MKGEDYKILEEQVDFGKKMESECRKLIEGEKVRSLKKIVLDQRGEINGNRRELNAAYKKLEELTRGKGNYKSAHEDEQTKHENTRKLVKAVCHLRENIFGDKNYRRIINKIDNSINPKCKKAFRNMIALDREVVVIFKQKDEKPRKHMALEDNAAIKAKQEKGKGSDLKL